MGNEHIIVVDGETTPGEISSVIYLTLPTFLEINGQITGNGDFRSNDNELEYAILCHFLEAKWNI